MWYYDLLKYQVYASFFILMFLSSITILLLVRSGILIERLSKIIKDLGKDSITETEVIKLIEFAEKNRIHLRFLSDNLYKAGYKLVNLNNDIDGKLKLKLQRKLLARGIDV